jgi:hypothetical protein
VRTIEKSVAQLGFKFTDVRDLLGTTRTAIIRRATRSSRN